MRWERQVILARQNIYDGAWDKTPSMGWMFVPLVQYQGGGAAATLEPLKGHLDFYERHLAQNLTAGVQACYRGPRHIRRPDGRDYDAILHVNPALREKGLAVVYNPLETPIAPTLRIPLYYTGLTRTASIRINGGTARNVPISRNYTAEVSLSIPAGGMAWLTVE